MLFFRPASDNFTSDIHHWFLSSTQIPACVLEVGSAEDTSVAVRLSSIICREHLADRSFKLQIIGRTKTPFAVESGGHASNPAFSSTTGVHISLKRLNEVSLSEDKSTVTIGFGQVRLQSPNHQDTRSLLTANQTWAEVYQILDGSGVNVVGGRTPGPGVGGFTLGGGFSW